KVDMITITNLCRACITITCTHIQRECYGEIYSCDLFNECGKIDRLMDFLSASIFTQLVITEISSLDIIKIKVFKVAFVAFDFFRVRTITVQVEQDPVLRFPRKIHFPDAIFLRELYMREGGYDVVQIFLFYCINFGLYHNYLCSMYNTGREMVATGRGPVIQRHTISRWG
ncbi:hypothetical protein ACJX0J_019263, partial [Zea mays]